MNKDLKIKILEKGGDKKMKKTIAVAFVLGCTMVSTGYATFINPGFETGDFSGWTLSNAGLGNVVTSHQGDAGSLYLPVEGSYFARLYAGAGAGVYTMLSQPILLNSGDILSGWAAFDYRDYHPWDDAAYVKVYDGLGSVVATPWYEHGTAHSNYWDGPWTKWSWTAPRNGTYKLEYGVANFGDNSASSAALFDTIPEPITLFLFGAGLIGLGLRKRKNVAV